MKLILSLGFCVLAIGLHPVASVGDLLFGATLKNGDFGGGAAINTFPLPGSPPAILNSPAGVVFLPSEVSGRSNGLINYQLGPANHNSFAAVGTVSMDIRADRNAFVSGGILGDNYGFNQFHNGQGAFGAGAGRVANGPGTADDQLSISWNTWHSNVWYGHGSVTLEFDRWYDVGFTWRGPDNRFELWVNGVLMAADNSSPNTAWGSTGLGLGSGYNFGIGDNHERGVDGYNSASNMTFANIAIWNEHRPLGDTRAIPEPTAALGLSGLIVAWAVSRRRTIRTHGSSVRSLAVCLD